jgi:hypothetical protein
MESSELFGFDSFEEPDSAIRALQTRHLLRYLDMLTKFY